MFHGYLGLDGVSLINTQATERYLAHLLPGAALRPRINSTAIRLAIQEDDYRTPLLDDASWINTLDPASHDFLGLYPITVEGLDGDTLSAGVTEYLTDGGSVGVQRRASRPIRVTGLLVGRTPKAVQYGRDWLASTLRASGGAGTLQYFVAEPDVCEEGIFGPEIDVATRSFGLLTEGVYRYRFQEDELDPRMPLRARWDGAFGEGAVIRVGAAALNDVVELESLPPVQPVRRNHIINPTFRQSVDGYSFSANTWSLFTSGGADGGSYLRLTAPPYSTTTTTTSQTNACIPPASPTPSPIGQTSGAHGLGTSNFGTSQFGTFDAASNVATTTTALVGQVCGGVGTSITRTSVGHATPPNPFGETRFGDVSFGGSVPPPLITVTTIAGGVVAGANMLSIAVRGDAAVISMSTPGSSSFLASLTVDASADWQRVWLPVVTAAVSDVTVSISTTGTTDIDQVMLEGGELQEAYFDGAELLDGYRTSWEGDPDVSIARRVYLGSFEISRPDSQWRPFLEVLSGSVTDAQLVWGIRAEVGLDEQLLATQRQLFNVAAVSGVTVLQEITTDAQGCYLQVEFELVAGNPAAYGLPEPVSTVPLLNDLYADPELPISLLDVNWLSDPNSTVLTLPPAAPVILNPAIETITAWRRYYVPVPASAIADATESVPTVAITSGSLSINQVRVRFHANPFGWDPADVDPDSYCSEFVLSYLPPLTRIEVDGVLERAFASRGDRPQTAADHLLYGTDGGPISWARLSCAIPYLMTVDVPTSSSIDAFTLEVNLRRKF